MCIPIAAAAGVAMVASAGSAAMGAIGSWSAAKGQKTQLKLEASLAKTQAFLAGVNAEDALFYSKLNADTALSVAEINAGLTQHTADFNVSALEAAGEFNQMVFDGRGALILGQGEMEAAAREANADLRELDAQATLEQGNKDETALRLNYARLKSTQRANLAAAGVALDEGSALRIQADTDYFAEVDADMIHANAVRTAMGYRVQASNERTAGAFARVNAKAGALEEKARAMGAKIGTDMEIANTKLGASFEILQARANAQIEANNLLRTGRAEAANSRMQALSYGSRAGQALVGAKGISPMVSGVSSLLSGAANVASQWYSFQRAGVWG